MKAPARRLGAYRRVALVLAGGLAIASASPAIAANEVSVSAFLARANALKTKGIAAMFSSEVKALRELGSNAGAQYRARLKRERAAGRPSSCPPPNVKMDSDQFMAHLETYPAAIRDTVPLSTAVGDLFARNWPCR
jgi:hypothetical protein